MKNEGTTKLTPDIAASYFETKATRIRRLAERAVTRRKYRLADAQNATAELYEYTATLIRGKA